MDGITKKDVSILENPDYLSINKLAFQYSDGIIIASDPIEQSMKESVENSGKPFLYFNNSENYIDEYALFYEKILAESND
jgi:starch synthase